MIRPANGNDAAAIANIYNHYVRNTIITFETDAVPATEMAERMTEISSAGLPWLAYEQADRVVGYAYASKWKGRCAYRFSVESTVYIDHEHTRQGIGSQLYEALLSQLRAAGLHVVIGGIALPNEGSVALHERFGFEKAGHFQGVGFKFERWIDVGYWQHQL